MSSRTGDPGRWPLLSVTPGRLQLIHELQAIELPGALAPPDLRAAFEACETARARYPDRRLDDARNDLLAQLAWRPADAAVREFLRAVFARATAAGGLRLLADEALPVECLRDCGGDWSTAFPTVRLMRGAANRLPAPKAPSSPEADGDAGPRRVLIWSNPEGTPELPVAHAEADFARGIFEEAAAQKIENQTENQANLPRCTVRFLGRHLNEGDWHAAVAESDVVLYYGHGQIIGGHPAVPTRSGPVPFLPGDVHATQAPELVVFAACLAGPQLEWRGRPGAFLFPGCRLADRQSAYLRQFLREVAVGEPPHVALARANRLDAEEGDSRRFVFQLHGGSP